MGHALSQSTCALEEKDDYKWKVGKLALKSRGKGC